MDSNIAQFAGLTSDVQDMQGQSATNTAQVADVVALVGELQAQTDSAVSTLAGIVDQVLALQGDTDENASLLAAILSQVGALEGSSEATELLLIAIAGQIAELQGNVATNSSGIGFVGQQVAFLDSALNSLLAANNTLNGQISDLNGLILGMDSRVAQLEANQGAPPPPTPTPVPPTLLEQVLAILGPTGAVLPLVSSDSPPFTGDTFTTQGSIQALFTLNGRIETFSSPPGLVNDVPVVRFNGTDERAETPDENFWSADDSAGEAMSIGIWVNASDVTSNSFLSKWAPTEWEWTFSTISNGTLRFRTWDISTGKGPQVIMDSPISPNAWLFLVFTYDGRGGDTAADGMTIYVNSTVPPQTQRNTLGYSAMQNGSNALEIGSTSGARGGYGAMQMAGGAVGPFFTHSVLTLAEIQNLYVLGLDALGLN